MVRVLIPSDNTSFVVHLAKAYAKAGHEVVVGAFNFFLRKARYDFVHYLWPEEFSGWRPPDDRTLDRVRKSADWWAENAETVMTVNNLYPHCHEGDKRFAQLYDVFYERTAAIVHHSNASRTQVLQHFPAASRKPNLVATACSYLDLVRRDFDRAKLRWELGIAEKEFVILVFGALRMWPEVELIIRGFDYARVAGKRLLVVARYGERTQVNAWLRRYRQIRWSLWLKKTRAAVVNKYVPDEEIYRYFESADAVIIPRLRDLSSGVVGMTFSFGKLLIAPNHGAFPEYLAGTENLLYDSGDALSLAHALEKASALDRERIGAHNRSVADKWSWDGVVETCLDAMAQSRKSRVVRPSK